MNITLNLNLFASISKYIVRTKQEKQEKLSFFYFFPFKK